MRRLATPLLVMGILAAFAAPDLAAAKKAKARLGMFGKINGKTFAASNKGKADDPCVNGIYNPNPGILTIGAIECRDKGKRRTGTAVKKNYKAVVLSCGFFGGESSPTPPFEMPCPSSGYSEWRTGRFKIPVASNQWVASADFSGDGSVASSLRVRIEAFDGTSIRGKFFGAFTMPIASTTGEAVVDGEVAFDMPIRVR